MKGVAKRVAGWVAMVVLVAGPAGAAEPAPLVIGGGEPAGAYLPEAGAICQMINKGRPGANGVCLVEPSAGSIANIGLLREGAVGIAIVQSKIAADAVAGRGAFVKAGPYPALRVLFSLHGEGVVVVAGPDGGVKTPGDLKGRRVNLGRAGSFQRLMAEALLTAEGLAPSDLAAATEMDPAQAAKALCANQVDAAIFGGIHPMAEVEDAIDQCGATPLSLDDNAITAYLAKTPYFSRLVVEPGVYQGIDLPLASFGPRALVVTTDALPEAKAYAVVKAVFDGQPAFRALYPLLSGLDRRAMARTGATPPLHDGARRYFAENRLP